MIRATGSPGGWAPRRFWKHAAVQPQGGGFAILLDGRPLRTPGRALLLVPTEAFAEAVAAEWNAQGEVLDPRSMPATRLANTAIDRVTHHHDAVVETVAAYGGTDLLCYRAERPSLAARQREGWDPVLAWAARRFGAELRLVEGVMPVSQPAASLGRLRARVAAMDPFALSAFHDLVTLTGSLILALAVAEGHLAPEEGWRLSRLDEEFQAEEWGRVEEAIEMAGLRERAYLDAARLWTLLRQA